MPKKTFEVAESVGAVLIVQVKDNQEKLRNQIEHGCNIYQPISCFEEEWDKAHGRIEKRKYEVFEALPTLNKWQDDWRPIKQFVRVTRNREVISTQKKTTEVHYYICNGILSAKTHSQAIRKHWWVENKVHYVKDKIIQEDILAKRQQPLIFSFIIDFALNIMRAINVGNIRKFMYEASLDCRNIFDIIGHLII